MDAERAERMRRVNPEYVLRNWVAQQAIEAAERKEFESVEALVEQMQRDVDEAGQICAAATFPAS